MGRGKAGSLPRTASSSSSSANPRDRAVTALSTAAAERNQMSIEISEADVEAGLTVVQVVVQEIRPTKEATDLEVELASRLWREERGCSSLRRRKRMVSETEDMSKDVFDYSQGSGRV